MLPAADLFSFVCVKTSLLRTSPAQADVSPAANRKLIIGLFCELRRLFCVC